LALAQFRFNTPQLAAGSFIWFWPYEKPSLNVLKTNPEKYENTKEGDVAPIGATLWVP
jgi:hypothetical protein